MNVLNKSKIVMVSLDERPCNHLYPQLMPKGDYELVMIPSELLGKKKVPADTKVIHDWILDNVKDADVVILSMDTVCFGGIVPSRLHYETYDTLSQRTRIIEEIKEVNPNIKIYAFELIMRCPTYSSSDEEPDYYQTYGREIHLYGVYSHKEKLGILTDEEKVKYEEVKSKLDMEVLNDFVTRRRLNLAVLMNSLEYLKQGLIDYFIVPQDDASPYGFTTMDQEKVRDFIKKNSLELKSAMYPSADDTGLTLLARSVNCVYGVKPKVFVYYASSKGQYVIPSFEDRIISETVKFHIMALGGIQVYSLAESDILLAINIGSAMCHEDDSMYKLAYDIERNLGSYIEYINYAISLGKHVCVADVAHPNGSELRLLKMIHNSDLGYKISGYAGWNTSSNTIGCALCQTNLYMLTYDKESNDLFLTHRYYEDGGYMSKVRWLVTYDYLSKFGFDYFNVGDGKLVGKLVQIELDKYMTSEFPKFKERVKKIAVSMPWHRMFEIRLDLEMK